MSSTHQVTVVGATTNSVECQDDQRLLDAFLRAGVYLPNSCNQGTCGTCKVKVRGGVVDQPTPSETVLSADEQTAGYVLACQSTPRSDAQIEVPLDTRGGPRHPLRDLTGRIREIREIARDTVALTVALAQVRRGDEPDPNTAAMCVLALARLAGRHDWTEAAA